MKIICRVLLVLTILLFHSTAIFSQSNNNGENTEKLLIAKKLWVLQGGPESTTKSINKMILEIKNNSKYDQYIDIIEPWYLNIVKSDKFIERVMQLIADAFTLEEMEQMLVFFESPIGKKTFTVMPQLFEKSTDLANEIVQENSQELLKLIKQRKQELDNKKPSKQ